MNSFTREGPFGADLVGAMCLLNQPAPIQRTVCGLVLCSEPHGEQEYCRPNGCL